MGVVFQRWKTPLKTLCSACPEKGVFPAAVLGVVLHRAARSPPAMSVVTLKNGRVYA